LEIEALVWAPYPNQSGTSVNQLIQKPRRDMVSEDVCHRNFQSLRLCMAGCGSVALGYSFLVELAVIFPHGSRGACYLDGWVSLRY
jgi:hypothetical protein